MNRIFRTFLTIMISVAATAAVSQTSLSAPSDSNASDAKAQSSQSSPRKVDRAAAYYHYTLAHMYEEMVTAYGRSDLASKATEEYRLAIDADPSSEFLTSGLAELYVKTGRIADAVREAQDIIKRDPKNLEAHKLLGRIYLRSLGDMPGGSGSDNILKLAIDQYEQIVKLDPDSVDDHLLLGRLYRLNNDHAKSGRRTQDRHQTRSQFGRSRDHAGHALHRRRRHGSRAESSGLHPGFGPLRQAVCRSRRSL